MFVSMMPRIVASIYSLPRFAYFCLLWNRPEKFLQLVPAMNAKQPGTFFTRPVLGISYYYRGYVGLIT